MYLVRSELFPLLSARCEVDCPDGASAWPSQKSTSSGSPSSLRLWICPAVLRSRSSCEHLHRTDVAARTLPERKDTCTNCVRLPGRGDSRPRCPSPRRPSILHVSVPVKGLFFFGTVLQSSSPNLPANGCLVSQVLGETQLHPPCVGAAQGLSRRRRQPRTNDPSELLM